MPIRYYAGIGSRQTPPTVQTMMRKIANGLMETHTLRSGHAPGADQAFEEGAGGVAQIFLPYKHFEHGVPIKGDVFLQPTDEAHRIAERYHPRWNALNDRGRLLHARNTHQVLGLDCETPAEFVICWTPGGKLAGGTAQALRIAKAHDIEVFNLGRSTHLSRARKRFL